MKHLILILMLLYGVNYTSGAQESTQNYIHTRTMLDASGSYFMGSTAYYDGLGRPSQIVNKSIKNGTQVDSIIATLQEYDHVSRETKSWLPIVITSDYITPDAFKNSAPDKYNQDSRPYSESVYEDSPLKRIVKQYAPGNAWSIHPVNTEYLTNTDTFPLNCPNYSVSETDALTDNGIYPAGQLTVILSRDEDLNVTYTFTDKLEHTVLVRQMKGDEAYDTYHVYDNFGNLSFVLPPAVDNDITASKLDRYAFQYKYDNRNRCIWKKMPGVAPVEYVYDKTDQLIFSQDGRQHDAGKWTYYLYDKFDRLTQQGECPAKNPSSDDAVVHIINYYDTYDFLGAGGFSPEYYRADRSNGKGYLTGSVITLLENNSNIYRANYYDIKGRPIKTVQSNVRGSHHITNIDYTFTGKPLATTDIHISGQDSLTEKRLYRYDHADRPIRLQHILKGDTTTLFTNTYDELGRLKTKAFRNSVSTLQRYSYNIRNWLTEINEARFNQKLYYADGVGTPCYNGNISSMTWRCNNDMTRGYKLGYDNLNRLTHAIYGEEDLLNTNVNRFTENVTDYDKNGNITALHRYGQTTSGAYGLVDSLTLALNGNLLNSVEDAVTAPAYNNVLAFKDGAHSAAEYAYDANGNLTKDLNKNITEIQYNILNLPSKVVFGSGDTISYIYAADGTKHRTIHKVGGITSTTDYCGKVIYENNVARRLLTEEGYVSLNDLCYHYYLKDHQGNTRMVIYRDNTTQKWRIEETNHYYPFGGMFASTGNVQPYKYNGKELNTKSGLNWYDYGARHYDAALGRFTTMDLLAEKYYSVSPYAYCENNPINRIDPDGKQVIIPPTLLGMNPPLLGTSNPMMATGRNIGMLGTADKVVRTLPKESHHIIPRSLRRLEIIKTARQGGFKLDGKGNRISVDKFSKTAGEGQHGKHPNYTEQIKDQLLNRFKDNPQMTPKQAVDAVNQVKSGAKNAIQNNPNTKINDLKLEQQIAPMDNTKIPKPIDPIGIAALNPLFIQNK